MSKRRCFNTGRTHFKKGHKPWNDGLTKDIDDKVRQTGEKISITKRLYNKNSIALEVRYCKNCGKSKEVKVNSDWEYCRGHNPNSHKPHNIATCVCGRCQVKRGEWRGKNHPMFGVNRSGSANTFYGCKHTEEARRKQSLAHGGTGNPKGDDYGGTFTDELKESVRKRDNYTCQLCGMTEEEHLIIYGMNLHVHHIDYNKLNSVVNNLTALCLPCNNRVNYNRKYWEEVFSKKVEIK
jgi:hypothetical protein